MEIPPSSTSPLSKDLPGLKSTAHGSGAIRIGFVASTWVSFRIRTDRERERERQSERERDRERKRERERERETERAERRASPKRAKHQGRWR